MIGSYQISVQLMGLRVFDGKFGVLQFVEIPSLLFVFVGWCHLLFSTPLLLVVADYQPK